MTPAHDTAVAPSRPAATPLDGFAEWVARTPEAPAVVCGPQSLTYRRLDRAAEQLGRRLRAAGAGPETLVAVALRRSAAQSVAVLGVLKAGAACLPVDPEQPPDRTRAQLADAGVRLVVTEKSVEDTRAEGGWGPQVVALPVETDLTDDGPGDGEQPLTGSGPENLMYVLYTSGSTGRPKGIAMHAAPPLLRLWLAKRAEEDHVLGLTVHHILFDRDSLDILSREVSAAYRAFTTGTDPASRHRPRSTRTSRGSRRVRPGRRTWTGGPRRGGSGYGASRRYWNCPPTTNGPDSPATAPDRRWCGCRPTSAENFARSAMSAAPRPSWSSSPRSTGCWGGWPHRKRWLWAVRSTAAARWHRRG